MGKICHIWSLQIRNRTTPKQFLARMFSQLSIVLCWGRWSTRIQNCSPWSKVSLTYSAAIRKSIFCAWLRMLYCHGCAYEVCIYVQSKMTSQWTHSSTKILIWGNQPTMDTWVPRVNIISKPNWLENVVLTVYPIPKYTHHKKRISTGVGFGCTLYSSQLMYFLLLLWESFTELL